MGLTNGGRPYGTGAFVAWCDAREEPNGTLILRDNEFEFASGCGDRPVVSIGGCEVVELVGRNRFVSGGTAAALALDPLGGDERPVSSPNGRVRIARDTRLEGALMVGAQTKELSELAH